MLPYEIESDCSIRARFDEALIPIYNPETMDVPPGKQRKHVFDFKDGVRLIVSRDQIAGIPAHVHVSASAFGMEAERCRSRGGEYFIEKVKQRWIDLGRKPLELIGMSQGNGVPHFIETE